MDEAIRLATIAASYSVSREGVQNAIINPDLLDELARSFRPHAEDSVSSGEDCVCGSM